MDDQQLAERIDGDLLERRINYHYNRLHEYLGDTATWCATENGVLCRAPVGYLSAEFGLNESLPLYSGGLGVLYPISDSYRWHRPVLRPGILPPAHRRIGLETGGVRFRRHRYIPLVRAASADGASVMVKVQCGADTLHARV